MSLVRRVCWSVFAFPHSVHFWTAPHSLSYFNELAGGPLPAPLAARNDIGLRARRLYLVRVLRSRPEMRPLFIALHANWEVDATHPEYVRVDNRDEPKGFNDGCEAVTC